ncbi:DNA repair protein RecN (Recombination protein N) [Lewinella marina]|uniref:DNA repair protein RecN n=1 Tax=Neolewinella marina TaxID=438751 RepID=A0A2G0CFJ4_9BACT|nr:DNA repair protein RecN [Neolewinella marina]NJB85571.1 DNA repair protein RecN (Recombination protein N) [Neolewinella marina]PHK98745.1 DNA repair protein RecN [Neolewinella marina]
MIKRLHIRNYAIIEELTLEFATGLSIITGETGAGKSIVLGALNLILGGRADTKTLFDDSRKCIIEGRFDIAAYDLRSFFTDNDLDYDAELIIRREITPSGKSRAFVNDTPVNLKVLQELGSTLIDLHQQFDTLYINNSDFQLELLDALAGQRDAVREYRTEYQRLQQTRRKLAQLREEQAQARREQEFLEFQVNELEEANLRENEQESLEAERHRLSNADEIKQLTSGVFHYLTEADESVTDRLLAISVKLTPLSAGDPQLQSIAERFESIRLELEEVASDLEAFGSDTDVRPDRLEEIEERLNLLYRLQTKHSVKTNTELLEIYRELSARLDHFSDLGGSITKLEKEQDQLRARLVDQGKQLRKARERVAPDFAANVQQQLGELSMTNARLKVDFTPLPEPGPHGLDEVRFLFSANKGGKLQAIKDAASGGEMSRLALVTKSLVASAMQLPTLIFDEIDSGVSGDVAQRMGRILTDLSRHHQVVVITHSPQVASRAHRHYFVYKTDKTDAERTITRVRELDGDERVRAIATMLSQNPPSESALKNARELIEAV